VIEIQLKRGKLEVVKTPYIKEEVLVKKRAVTDTKEFTRQIILEQVYPTNM
jgi:stress response protein YsnF